MSQRDPGVYLEDIEHYAAAAIRFTASFSLEQYLADEKTRAILAHGYAELDQTKVYKIAIAHAPQRLLAVREALKAFPDPPS